MEKKETKVYAVRNYKDTVFRKLFNDRRNLLSLYNAVNGTKYTKPDALEIVTLDSAIYMGMKNDLAFLVDFQMHLYEQQSSFNPNMPLRFLQYVAREYEKIMNGTGIYTGKLLKIPAPHFVVFYNGMVKQPKERILRLSDAYITPEEVPQLELEVRIININAEDNAELLKQCRILKEYALYVEKVRKYTAQASLTDAVNRAVDECIREGILANFLRENRAEVIAMSILECDIEEIKEAIKEAARDDAWEEGRAAGIKAGRREGIKAGRQEGMKVGIQQAKEEMILKMKKSGLTVEEIAAIADISIEAVQNIL